MPPAPRPLQVVVTACAVPVLVIAADLVARGALLPRDAAATYLGGAVLSLLVWSLGLEAARHPRRPVRAAALVFLGLIAAFGLGLQIVVRAFTHAYLGRRALLLALGIPNLAESSYLTHNAPKILAACFVPAALVVSFALARARRLGPRRRHAGLAAAGAALVVVVTLFAPLRAQGLQPLPPDVLLLNGTGGPLLYAMGLTARPKALPVGRHQAVTAAPAPPDAPSVILIVGESVRRDAVCAARGPACALSPAVDRAAPDRIGYARAHAVASCTELSTAALWTGLPVTTPPDALARAPLLWDRAHARGYRTAYITAQNLLFQQMDLFLRGSRIDLLREARSRDLRAHIDDGSPDEELTAEALAFLDADPRPAFLVVHHANTHAPYRQVDGYTPFAGGDALTRYRNSVVHEDALVGDLIARLRGTEVGRRAVVIYTSDHGEAWGEHGAYYHSFDLYAEQTDVPLWIDAPSLPADVGERLRRDAGARAVSMLDLSATVADLLGALGPPGELAGQSLLREPVARDVLLWNCPPSRECATEAFGIVRFPMKLHYVGHEQRYVCSDLSADPGERAPLPVERCAALRPALDRSFGRR